MAVNTFTKSGAKSTKAVSLPKDVFGLNVENHDLLKQVYVAQMANRRLNLAKTLKRGEVSGGGKKPWRQKGTGNARTGSIRNPIWRGGGITFGPQGNENYSKKINQKSKNLAIKQALSMAVNSKRLVVLESLDLSSGKSKDAGNLLAKIGAAGKTLIVAGQIEDSSKKALSNLPDVCLVNCHKVTVKDLLDYKSIVITEDAVKSLNDRLGGK